MASEPALFPAPSHRTFVRCAHLPWPAGAVGHQAVCRGCVWESGVYERYGAAYGEGFRHSQEIR
jgi:hypothetical protein